jgi:hypothetical protein
MGATLAICLLQYTQPPSPRASAPSLLAYSLLGGFIAILLGICVIILKEKGRETVSSPQELEAISRHPVLATVPFTAGLEEVRLLSPRPIEHAADRSTPRAPRPATPPPTATVAPPAVEAGSRRFVDITPVQAPAIAPAAIIAEVAQQPRVEPQPAPLPVAPQAATAAAQQLIAQPPVVEVLIAAVAPPQDAPPVEVSQWETLRAVMTNLPPGSSPAIVPSKRETVGDTSAMVESKPLLKRSQRHESALITRSTADSFPLPSVVPGAPPVQPVKTPVAKVAPTATAPASVAAMTGTTSPVARIATPTAAPLAIEPVTATMPAPQTTPPIEEPSPLPLRRDNIAEQQEFTPLRQNISEDDSKQLPDDTTKAARSTTQVARNQQGKIDYVTFTFDLAQSSERRGRES